MNNALHFVGFKSNARIAQAAQIFGAPDFYHRYWDVRAQHEIMPGDVAIFADGGEDVTPNVNAYDDSAYQ